MDECNALLPSYLLAFRLTFTSPFRYDSRMPRPSRYFPSLDEFETKAARGAEIVPVYRQLLGDHLTPVTAFEVLGRDAHAFLLESVVGGERIARNSFIATSPSLVYQVAQGNGVILERGQRPKEFRTTDPLHDLAQLLPQKRYHR